MTFPFICGLCNKEGHFNFQCMYFQNMIANQLCDNMITPDLYDQLELFMRCEELSDKTSWLDINNLGTNSTLQKCHSYCAMNCRENVYIGKMRKNGTLPKYERKKCFLCCH